MPGDPVEEPPLDQQLGLLGIKLRLNAIRRFAVRHARRSLGGKLTMFLLVVVSAIASFLVPFAHDYPTMLGVAFLVGIAGNGFTRSVGMERGLVPEEPARLRNGLLLRHGERRRFRA